MSRRALLAAVAVVAVAGGSGCPSKLPSSGLKVKWTVGKTQDGDKREYTLLTPALTAEHQLKDGDFTQLQYYIDEDVLLHRTVSEEEQRTLLIKGKLVRKYGKTMEEISVAKLTPGVCEKSLDAANPDLHRLEVSFGQDKDSTIVFRKAQDGSYQIERVQDGADHFVHLGKEKYRVVNGANARLLIEKQSLNNVETKRKTLPGRKLDLGGDRPEGKKGKKGDEE